MKVPKKEFSLFLAVKKICVNNCAFTAVACTIKSECPCACMHFLLYFFKKKHERAKDMSELCERVKRLDSMLNTDKILSGKFNSIRDIKLYYLINRIPYRRMHSREGFMHFHVSKDGTFSEDDIYYQPETISAYIPLRASVLELGPGQGANLLYLARHHPDADFCGVDLLPVKLKNAPPNLHVIKRDYSEMSNFPDGTFDVVYAIETIVHSSEKDSIFKEAYRVLKPGGTFIVYNYALSRPYDDFDPLTQKAVSLISKGGVSPVIEQAETWENYFLSNGFQRVKVTDLSRAIMPDLKRLQHKAERIMRHPVVAKAVFRILPWHFSNNIIIGYLGYDSFREGVILYKEWVFRK